MSSRRLFLLFFILLGPSKSRPTTVEAGYQVRWPSFLISSSSHKKPMLTIRCRSETCKHGTTYSELQLRTLNVVMGQLQTCKGERCCTDREKIKVLCLPQWLRYVNNNLFVHYVCFLGTLLALTLIL